jgi:phage-related protein
MSYKDLKDEIVSIVSDCQSIVSDCQLKAETANSHLIQFQMTMMKQEEEINHLKKRVNRVEENFHDLISDIFRETIKSFDKELTIKRWYSSLTQFFSKGS